MVTFVGAGPGAKDLITVRGQRLLEEADIVIYAGSLVNPKLLYGCKETCAVYNSAKMTLEEVLEVIKEGETQRKNIVRLHTGDPCLYGAIKEQMDELERLGIGYEVCPGVSSFCAAARAWCSLTRDRTSISRRSRSFRISGAWRTACAAWARA